MIGIIEEQHPYRARLFMQWKRMDWPIMVDKLNLLGVSAVPVTVFIDKEGIVQAVGPAQEDFEAFLNEDFPRPEQTARKEKSPPDLYALQEAATGGYTSALRDNAETLFMWGGTDSLDGVIEAYDKVLQAEPGYGPTHFRLGVAYRNRYDSPSRRPLDFNNAIANWRAALEIDPNQHIWRRRIQQYGLRLDKPYPFYDWVIQDREDIAARGETPSPLLVEPGGGEFANPAKTFETSASSRPKLELKAHWNNEAADQVFWIDPPPGWEVDRRWISVARPPSIVSQEARRIEFEIKGPEGFGGQATIPAYTLYYVYEDVAGICIYRRQDMPIEISSDEFNGRLK